MAQRSQRFDSRRDRGFTLIEVLLIVALLGVIAGWVTMDFVGITDNQRIGATAREFVGIYRRARNFASKERRECYLEFSIETNEFRLLVYPRRDESGRYTRADGTLLDSDEQERLIAATKWKKLERDVYIQDIEAPAERGSQRYDGEYWLKFRQDGTIPPHIVHLISKGGLKMSIEIEEITGAVTVKEGHTAFYSPREDEFNIIAGGESSGK